MRIQQIFRGMYGIQLSTGTIQTMVKYCAALVRPTVEMCIKPRIQKATVAHIDETSTKVNGKKHWIHATVLSRRLNSFIQLAYSVKGARKKDITASDVR